MRCERQKDSVARGADYPPAGVERQRPPRSVYERLLRSAPCGTRPAARAGAGARRGAGRRPEQRQERPAAQGRRPPARAGGRARRSAGGAGRGGCGDDLWRADAARADRGAAARCAGEGRRLGARPDCRPRGSRSRWRARGGGALPRGLFDLCVHRQDRGEEIRSADRSVCATRNGKRKKGGAGIPACPLRRKIRSADPSASLRTSKSVCATRNDRKKGFKVGQTFLSARLGAELMIIPLVEQAIRPLEESAGLRAAVRELELVTRHGQPPRELTLAGLTDTAKLLVATLTARALARPLVFLTTTNRREIGRAHVSTPLT